MGTEKCYCCDRAECRSLRPPAVLLYRAHDQLCDGEPVDWRARALSAEARVEEVERRLRFIHDPVIEEYAARADRAEARVRLLGSEAAGLCVRAVEARGAARSVGVDRFVEGTEYEAAAALSEIKAADAADEAAHTKALAALEAAGRMP